MNAPYPVTEFYPKTATPLPRLMSAAEFTGRQMRPRSWFCEGLLPGRQVWTCDGQGGGGKSLLLLQAAVCAVTGRAWLGRDVARGPVIYLASEDDEDEIHRRLHDICAHYRVGLEDLGDPWDPATWKLANPALGDFRSREDVERQAAQAQRIPSKEYAPMIDWHLDARFLTPEQEDHAHWVEGKDLRIRELPHSDHPGRWRGSRASRQIVLMWSGYDGLDWRDDEGFSDMANEPSVTDVRPLECRRPTTPPEPLWGPPSVNLAPFGDPAEPIRTAAGRLLCPHQKMDLTHEPRDSEGIVVCPLHRLRVKCG